MSVLIIEDEEIVGHTLKQLIKLRYDTRVTTAETVEIARQTLKNESFLVSDYVYYSVSVVIVRDIIRVYSSLASEWPLSAPDVRSFSRTEAVSASICLIAFISIPYQPRPSVSLILLCGPIQQ